MHSWSWRFCKQRMANDLNEEEAIVIGATTALLGATTALLRNHINRDIYHEIREGTSCKHEAYECERISSNVSLLNRSQCESSSFVGAADMISKKFSIKCLLDHVDNHLRIVKTTWGIIAKLRNQSGHGWDENMRMIRMSPDVYNTYVEANPTHEKYLNKKIDMYDEMATVVGKDVARGSGAKSFDDVDIQSHAP
ncbi:hypothetical protein Cgig2_001584 [Carnegiea gigantea]|uniref:Uncharacterized protein n=1 Tax=Carnegiea gigantea TaxID=171969 RepID=A0A9Q1QFU0_9CARY|nr:hypothetical protein Cgig2_001584 [Carnegiea gigantea]